MTRLYKSMTTSMTKISLISFFSLLVSPITAQVIVTVTVSASAQPTSPSYATPTEFESQVLKFTNRYRADYNASAVTWNTTLAQFAQRWSQGCVFQHSVCVFIFPSSYSLSYGSFIAVDKASDVFDQLSLGWSIWRKPGRRISER